MVLVLPVASSLRNLAPAVIFDLPNKIADLHCFQAISIATDSYYTRVCCFCSHYLLFFRRDLRRLHVG